MICFVNRPVAKRSLIQHAHEHGLSKRHAHMRKTHQVHVDLEKRSEKKQVKKPPPKKSVKVKAAPTKKTVQARACVTTTTSYTTLTKYTKVVTSTRTTTQFNTQTVVQTLTSTQYSTLVATSTTVCIFKVSVISDSFLDSLRIHQRQAPCIHRPHVQQQGRHKARTPLC